MKEFKTLSGATILFVVLAVLNVLYVTRVFPLWDPSHLDNTPFKHGINVGECITMVSLAGMNLIYRLTQRLKARNES